MRTPLVSVTKKDFAVTYYKGSGNGGQKRNKTMSGVRISHPDSGAVASDCSTPSQLTNKRTAFKRLVDSDKFAAWLRKETAEALMSDTAKRLRDEAIQRRVDAMMADEFLKVEYFEPTG